MRARSRQWFAAFGLGVSIAAVADCSAFAYSWSGVAQQCAAEIAQQNPDCGSCSALWPDISRCVASRLMPGAPSVEQCIARTNEREWRAAMAHDRVAETIRCISGGKI